MSENRFRESLLNPKRLTVVVEFTCPAGQKPQRMLKFLSDWEAKTPKWSDAEIAAVTVTHNPSGVVTASPSDVYAHIQAAGGTRGLTFIPHVSAKGMNRAEIETYLRGLASHGIEDCFVVTGDKPLVGKSVFEFDSLNLLRAIRKMNADARVAGGADAPAPAFFTGAGVGLAKYEEGTCIQQMLKVEKKVRYGGAGFLITNLIYDPRKVEDFFRFLRERDIRVPVIGNVFFLTEPAARRMRHEKLPGCFVSEALYARVAAESRDQWIERCAQLAAMWRDLGAAGVDLGNVEDLALTTDIIERAKAIGSKWREQSDNLSFPPEGNNLFYLYAGDGKPTPLRKPKAPFRRRMLNRTHQRLFEPDTLGYKAMRSLLKHTSGMREGQGFLYESFYLMETVMKRVMAKCQACGDCFLPENFFVCLMGECTKGLTNVPCADSTADGRCGVDTNKLCASRQVYDAARFFGGDIEALRLLINPSKDPELLHTSSFRNFFLTMDHHRRNPLVVVGEQIHTTIPKVKKAFDLIKGGRADFAPDNPGVQFIRAAVESQILKGADYLDCNVDDAGGGDAELATRLMRGAVRLIVEHGEGAPPCVDSSDVAVLRAGLEEYYRVAPSHARAPLVNSANGENLDKFWDLLHTGPFNVVYMLMESSLSAKALGQYVTPEQMLASALRFFREATKRGFAPEQIYFDTTVMPLAVEFSCFDRPGYSYCSFQAMRRIMKNEEMKGVGTILGISNLTRDFPSGRKIGVLRAYVHLAMQYGLTAAIVDVEKDFGLKPPEDDEIVDIVKAFIEHDGSAEAYQRMQDAYGRYRSYAGAKG
jgi:methylenetetrahydrofolate reductase (NADPH)